MNWNLDEISVSRQGNLDLEHIYNSLSPVSHKLAIIHRWCYTALAIKKDAFGNKGSRAV